MFATHIFTTSSAVKPTERTTKKKKQFHVMMKNLFYLIIRIRLHILWYSKMHCRRVERWYNGQSGDVIVSGEVETKFRE